MRKILYRINALISLEIKSRIQKRAQDARLFKCISKNGRDWETRDERHDLHFPDFDIFGWTASCW